jgi:Secretion system C-terminal sorting domain
MKKNLLKIIILGTSIIISKSNFAQNGTLEFTTGGNTNALVGPSTAPVSVAFWNDASNPTPVNLFTPQANPLIATFALQGQTRSTTLSGTSTVVQGMTFGGRTTSSAGTGVQQIGNVNIYDPLGAGFSTNGVALPLNSMFQTSPTASPASRTDRLGQPGATPAVGFDCSYDAAGTYIDPINGSQLDANHAIALYNTVEPLFDANLPAAGGRYAYGQLVITFNRAVQNPVVHLGGLGGSYSYLSLAGVPSICYFTTELELVNAGVTSTFMAGNEFFNISGNNVLNSAVNPNAGSYAKDDCNDQGACSEVGNFPNYGAASGSVRINGVVTQLVYNVFIRGGINSMFNFSKNRADINNPTATNDPFNGDLYYISVSLDKPVGQSLRGNVFVDADGLNDAGGGDINKTAGAANPGTNIGNTLYASLIGDDPLASNFGKVVAVEAIGANGAYLFDNVPVGKYKVVLSSINPSVGANAPAAQLPAGWVNTGEFQSDFSTVGSDGVINGISQQVDVSEGDKEIQVNFGIERLPESVSFRRPLDPNPVAGRVYILNSNALAPLSYPVLSGSDAEDQPATGILNTKTVKITSLLDNPISKLYYNNVLVTLNQVITNFDPSKLEVRFIQSPQFPELPGKTIFEYAYIDRAGLIDPTPAFYELYWPGEVTPIVLESFEVTKSDCNANLVWKTASELNADKFELEVSTNGAASYGKFATVASANAATGKNYVYSFPMQQNVTYYFRLKSIDKDGSFKYSDYRKMNCAGKGLISIVPNPVADIFRISGMAKGRNNVMIYAADGKLVKTQVITNTFGEISIGFLTTGMYVVNVVNEDGTTHSERLIKK